MIPLSYLSLKLWTWALMFLYLSSKEVLALVGISVVSLVDFPSLNADLVRFFRVEENSLFLYVLSLNDSSSGDFFWMALFVILVNVICTIYIVSSIWILSIEISHNYTKHRIYILLNLQDYNENLVFLYNLLKYVFEHFSILSK